MARLLCQLDRAGLNSLVRDVQMKPGHATRFIEHLRPSKAFEDNAVVSFEGSAASFNAPAADEDAGSKKGKQKDKKGKGYATPPTNSSPFDDGDDLVMVSLDDPGALPLPHKASPSALCSQGPHSIRPAAPSPPAEEELDAETLHPSSPHLSPLDAVAQLDDLLPPAVLYGQSVTNNAAQARAAPKAEPAAPKASENLPVLDDLPVLHSQPIVATGSGQPEESRDAAMAEGKKSKKDKKKDKKKEKEAGEDRGTGATGEAGGAGEAEDETGAEGKKDGKKERKEKKKKGKKGKGEEAEAAAEEAAGEAAEGKPSKEEKADKKAKKKKKKDKQAQAEGDGDSE